MNVEFKSADETKTLFSGYFSTNTSLDELRTFIEKAEGISIDVKAKDLPELHLKQIRDERLKREHRKRR